MQVRVKSKKELLKILEKTRHPDEDQSIEEFLNEEIGYNTFETKVFCTKKEYTRDLIYFDRQMFKYCEKIISVKKVIPYDSPYYFEQIDSEPPYWIWNSNWVENLTKIKIGIL